MLWWHSPRLLLRPAWFRVVTLWRASQGGMARGWLPGGGGINDQPNWLVEAFGMLNAEQHRLDERKRSRAEEG